MAACVDVFVYGTLMDENFLYSLTRCRFLRSEAELAGFERVSPSNGYPYIVPNPNRVAGSFFLMSMPRLSRSLMTMKRKECCIIAAPLRLWSANVGYRVKSMLGMSQHSRGTFLRQLPLPLCSTPSLCGRSNAIR